MLIINCLNLIQYYHFYCQERLSLAYKLIPYKKKSPLKIGCMKQTNKLV